MLHTSESSPPGGLTAATRATWVRCRSRLWKVLDVRDEAGSCQWWLSRERDVARTFAAPPDIVRDVPVARRRVLRTRWVRHVVRELSSIAPVWWPAAASQLPIVPLAYQYVPAMAMLSGHHRRVLVADEVGMGKTVQAGMLLHEIHSREPDASSLVVVPAALVRQWAQELRERALLEPAILDAATLRREALQPLRLVDASRAGTCWLISLDLLRQPEVTSLLARTPWTLTVIDEAHLAAPGTARLAAVSRVAAASVRVLLLTATPHAAGPDGVETLRGLGRRAGERPMLVLRRRSDLLDRPPRRTRVLQVRLDGAHRALCARLDGFAERARSDGGAAGLLPALVLRRRASSCPAALQRSLERRLEVLGVVPAPAAQLPLFDDEAEPDQDDQDDEVMRVPAWHDSGAERDELRRILALTRGLSAEGAKLRAVARLLRRCRQPAVVFTSFVDTLRALRSCLRGLRVVVVHGRQPWPLRVQAIEAFTTGEADVLLTTDASAEGLNLHARCRLVVHAEVPLSARTFLQRTGRVDRHGQSRRVHAVVFGSDSAQDSESIARLHVRAGDEETWMTQAAGRGCVRTTLAAGRLRARASPGPATDETGTGTAVVPLAPRVATCALRHRAWMRLAARAHWPADAGSAVVGVVRCGGGPMLTTCRVPVVFTSPAREGQAEPDVALRGVEAWQRLLPRAIARTRRLASRLACWEREAEAGCERERLGRARAPTLFDDAQRAQETPAAPPGAPAALTASLDIIARLERRR